MDAKTVGAGTRRKRSDVTWYIARRRRQATPRDHCSTRSIGLIRPRRFILSSSRLGCGGNIVIRLLPYLASAPAVAERRCRPCLSRRVGRSMPDRGHVVVGLSLQVGVDL